VTVDHAGACSNKNPAGDVAGDDDTKEGGVIQERSAQEDDKGPML
jgi:hypothetical protein